MLPFAIIKPYTLPSSPFSSLANGESHLLLLSKSGTLYGSGSNANSQLNQSTGTSTGSYNTFVTIDTGVDRVWAGDNSTFWTSTAGKLYFCGLNTNTSSTLYRTGLKQEIVLPPEITTSDISKIVVLYDSGVCLITNTGRAFCHGTNTSTLFRPYIDTSTNTLPSFTFFDSATIPSTWVEVVINAGAVKVKDFMLNTSFGSSSPITRHSGTFVGTDNIMYRYLNAGWNNISPNSAYYPNVSFYKVKSTYTIGFNYSEKSIRRASNREFPAAPVIYGDLYYILNSYGSISSTAYSAVQANPNNLTSLQCLNANNGAVIELTLSGVIGKITGSTNLYSILTTSNVYLLTRDGVLTNINYSTIA